MADNKRMWRSDRKRAAGVLALVGLGTVGTAAVTGIGATAAPVCRTSTLAWTAPAGLTMTSFSNQLVDTGLTVAAGDVDEVLRITASSYASHDRYPDNASPTRAEADQQHEQWGLRIGGSDFGQLSSDVPDLVSEGAPSPWFSGDVTGTLGTGPVRPGAVVLRHASLAGFTESPNSVRPTSVALTVEYCRDVVDTTTTAVPSTAPEPTPAPTTVPVDTTPETTTPETTTPETSTTQPIPSIGTSPTTAPTATTTPRVTPTPAPATTSTMPITPSTAAASTTVVVPSTAPASTTTVPVATPTTAPTSTTTPDGTLPSTGGEFGGLVRAAGLLTLLGGALLLARRRIITA